MEWVQDPLDTYWYRIMVSAGVLYTQDEGSSPYTSTILEYQSGLMAQSAKLMIREFKSHLQVYVPIAQLVRALHF